MPVEITSISPPRGRLGDGITITGTGFSATDNGVRLIQPDGTGHVQTIFSQNATTIVISSVSGAATVDFQHTIEVTNNDTTEIGTHAWFIPKSLVALETAEIQAQQPGAFEALATERPTIAEAKDYERLAALTEFARDATVTANAKQLQGVDIDAAAPTSGDVLEYDGIDYNPVPVNAREIQGEPVSATTPTTGQVLEYSGSQWAPQAPSVGAVAKFVDATAGATSTYTIPGSTLGADSDRLLFRAVGDVTGGSADVQVTLDGTQIAVITGVNSGDTWSVIGEIVRTGSSAQKCWALLVDISNVVEVGFASLAKDMTTALDLVVKKSGGGPGTVSVETFTVDFFEAP